MRVFTTTRICRLLHIDRSTLRRFVKQGFKLPRIGNHKGVGRARLWDFDDRKRLTLWMQRRCTSSYLTKFKIGPRAPWRSRKPKPANRSAGN